MLFLDLNMLEKKKPKRCKIRKIYGHVKVNMRSEQHRKINQLLEEESIMKNYLRATGEGK